MPRNVRSQGATENLVPVTHAKERDPGGVTLQHNPTKPLVDRIIAPRVPRRPAQQDAGRAELLNPPTRRFGGYRDQIDMFNVRQMSPKPTSDIPNRISFGMLIGPIDGVHEQNPLNHWLRFAFGRHGCAFSWIANRSREQSQRRSETDRPRHGFEPDDE